MGALWSARNRTWRPFGSVQLLTSSLGAATDEAVAGAALAGLPARAGAAEPSASATVERQHGQRNQDRVEERLTAAGLCHTGRAMSVVIETVESRALVGNPLGDPTARRSRHLAAAVVRARNRAPLPGRSTGWPATAARARCCFRGTPGSRGWATRLDRLVGSGAMGEAIVVAPDCFTRWGGAQYLDSPAIGNYETHLARELSPRSTPVFAPSPPARRAPSAASRRAASARWCWPCATPICSRPSPATPATWPSSCRRSRIFPSPRAPCAATAASRRSSTHFEASEKKCGDDYTTMMVLAQAGAYSPEAGRPGGVALPFDIETGELDWAVWKRWKAWDPIELLPAHAEALRGMKLLYRRRGHARRAQPGSGRADLRGAAARAGRRLRAPGVRRRPPRDGVPLRRLAPQAGGGCWRRRRRAEPTRACAPAIALALTCDNLDDDGAGVGERGGHARAHRGRAARRARGRGVVEHVSRQSGAAWARLETVDAPSPARRPPACPAFGACGGCVLQHLDVRRAAGVEAGPRRARVRRAPGAGRREGRRLRRVATAARLPEPSQAGRRPPSRGATDGGSSSAPSRRARTTSSISRAAGSPSRRSTRPPPRCARSSTRRASAPTTSGRLTGDLRHVVLRANHEGRVLAVWIVARPLPDGVALARRLRAARPEVIGVVEHENRTRGNAIFSDSDGGHERLLDGVGEIEDQVDVAGRPCACGSRRARSSRRTGRSPPSPTPPSPRRWRSAPPSAWSTPTAASAGSR